MTLRPGYSKAALAAAIESATVKALTGDSGTDMYAKDDLTGRASLDDVPRWQTRTSLPDQASATV